MERDSFIFYKSFYEAITNLPKDIRLEVLTAVIEYALFGRQPDSLKPFAKGMFTLIKPNIDANNTRRENGAKGGRKSRTSSAKPFSSAKNKQVAAAEAACSLTYEQEVEQMRSDAEWRKTVCEDFNITDQEYDRRLDRFLDRCNDDKSRKGKEHHDSLADCQSHLRYWMSKAYAHNLSSAPAPEDDAASFPEEGDSFGAMDYDEL